MSSSWRCTSSGNLSRAYHIAQSYAQATVLGYLSTIHQQAYLPKRFSVEAQRVYSCLLWSKVNSPGVSLLFRVLVYVGDALRRTPEQRRVDTQATTVGLRRKGVALR